MIHVWFTDTISFDKWSSSIDEVGCFANVIFNGGAKDNMMMLTLFKSPIGLLLYTGECRLYGIRRMLTKWK